MARTISRLLNNTVLGLNGISNKALKTYRPLIAPQLIDIAKAYFIIGYYLRFKRAIIIFILYKEGKADYLFLGSYRPIALENTLSKILERVMADYIADIAKKIYPTTTKPNGGKKKPFNTISIYTTYCYY